MASRRELKKNVNYIAGELFTECLINSMFIPGTDKAKADELMAAIFISSECNHHFFCHAGSYVCADVWLF